jgi:hypothetical protein
MKKLFATLIALSLSFALNAHALTIGITPSTEQLNVGDNVLLQVDVSGLNDLSTPALGVYDLNLNYDANLFAISDVYWGDAIKGNQLDLSGFGSLHMSDSSLAGSLNIFELSFDDAWSLENLQAGSFTLFSVMFSAINQGTSNFSLDVNALGDAYGNNLFVNSLNNSNAVSVPEPSAIILIMIGLITLGASRLKQQV